MSDFKTGAVVLIKFPFTDALSSKRRPALMLLDSGDHDRLLARVTTQRCDSPFDCELKDWSKAGLKAPSFVRLHKLATLEKKLVEKAFGQLTAEDLKLVQATWRTMDHAISVAH